MLKNKKTYQTQGEYSCFKTNNLHIGQGYRHQNSLHQELSILVLEHPEIIFQITHKSPRNSKPLSNKFPTSATLAFRKTPKMCWLKPGGIWWDTPPFNHQGHHRPMDSHLAWGFTLDSSMKMVISFCTFGPTHGVNEYMGRNIKSWFGYTCHTLYENLGLIISGSFTGKIGTHLFQTLCLIALVNGDGSSFFAYHGTWIPKNVYW